MKCIDFCIILDDNSFADSVILRSEAIILYINILCRHAHVYDSNCCKYGVQNGGIGNMKNPGIV